MAYSGRCLLSGYMAEGIPTEVIVPALQMEIQSGGGKDLANTILFTKMKGHFYF